MDESKIKREICDRITKLSYKRPKTEKDHNMICGAKIELEDLLDTIRTSDGNADDSSDNILHIHGVVGSDCLYCGKELKHNVCDNCDKINF